jgi:glycine dehydrogenase subunit 1
MPGRIVGATRDIEGRRAYVMTLRTREQDIRRERATSNICTNVALQALAATVYLATMGKRGMRQTAELCIQKAHYAAEKIARIPGYALTYISTPFFKEFSVTCPATAERVNAALWRHGIIGGFPVGEREMLIAVTEMRTRAEIDKLVDALASPELFQNERNGSSDVAQGSMRTTSAV